MKHTVMKRACLLFVFCCCARVYGQHTGYLCQDGFGFVPTITLEDTITTKFIYIDSTLPGNTWQIGIPQKITFNSAVSPVRVLATDTINNYPAGNRSVFYMKMSRCNVNADVVSLTFQHRYDTDTLADGGTIEISLDNGLTFANLSDAAYLASFNVCFYGSAMGEPEPNFYPSSDTVAALSAPGFSGNSGDSWAYYGVNLFTMWSMVDTIIVRFVFQSDSVDTGREGWIIDDIQWEAYIVGIKETEQENALQVYPNPATQNISIGSSTGESFDFSVLDLSGRCVQTGKIKGVANIDISHDTPGIYWIVARNNQHLLQAKFIKE